MCCETALGVTLSSAAARTKLPKRALASKAFSAFRGGSLRDIVVFRRRRFSFSTRRRRESQYSHINSGWVALYWPRNLSQWVRSRSRPVDAFGHCCAGCRGESRLLRAAVLAARPRSGVRLAFAYAPRAAAPKSSINASASILLRSSGALSIADG